jgi:pectate lyase
MRVAVTRKVNRNRSVALKLLLLPALLVPSLAVLPLSSASAATTATDDFNRAGGGLGPNWTDMTDGGMAISSQQVVGTNGTSSGDIRSAETSATDPYSEVGITSTQLTGGQWVGPVVRAQNGGQDLYLGLSFWNYGNPVLMLFTRVDSAWTQLGSTYSSGALTAGTVLQLSIAGSELTFSENGAALIAASDTSLTGGAPGIMAYGTPSVDDWSGGDGSPDQPPADAPDAPAAVLLPLATLPLVGGYVPSRRRRTSRT